MLGTVNTGSSSGNTRLRRISAPPQGAFETPAFVGLPRAKTRDPERSLAVVLCGNGFNAHRSITAAIGARVTKEGPLKPKEVADRALGEDSEEI